MENDNFFTDKDAVKTIDTIRIIYFLLFISSFVITEIGRFVYRPFIYENKINDYGIADSIGNLGGIIVQIFFMLTILNSPKKKGFRIIAFLVIGYTLYEIIQPYLPKGTFDLKDIYGTIIGGFISLLLFLLIHRNKKNKIKFKF